MAVLLDQLFLALAMLTSENLNPGRRRRNSVACSQARGIPTAITNVWRCLTVPLPGLACTTGSPSPRRFFARIEGRKSLELGTRAAGADLT